MKSLLPLVLLLVLAAAAAGDSPATRLAVAEFDGDGNLRVPGDLDTWIFLGSSLGMGYSQQEFDPDSPGMFQIVSIEPNAYRAFLETGRFVNGTMFALHFYGSQNEISINRAGFVMDNLHFAEIHFKDSDRYPDGFNFFTFEPGDAVAREVALPNDCVDCHKRDGAWDGVFVQFYPTIHEHLPGEVRTKLAASRRSGGH